MYFLVYVYADLANATSMLNNISKLQFQQIVEHPQITPFRIQNLSKTYTYNIIVENCQTQFYVLQTCRYFVCIYISHQKIVTAFLLTSTSKFSTFSTFIQKLVVKCVVD